MPFLSVRQIKLQFLHDFDFQLSNKRHDQNWEKILGQVETYSTSYVVCIVCAKSEEKYEIKARKNSDNKNIRC